MPYHTNFTLILELTSLVHRGDIKCIYSELALYGSENERARTATVFFPTYQVCARGVTLLAA